MVPLGTAFGIKLFTDGVIVVSLSQISTGEGPRCPAEEAGLRPGDYLLEADGMAIQNNTALAAYIGRSQGQPIRFTVRRGDQVSEAQVTPVYGTAPSKRGCGCGTAPPALAPSPSTTGRARSSPAWATASATGTPAPSWP